MAWALSQVPLGKSSVLHTSPSWMDLRGRFAAKLKGMDERKERKRERQEREERIPPQINFRPRL